MAASRPSKMPASAMSATTVVVLAAMASAVCSRPAPAQAERAWTGERNRVAAMATAVAAVARDLMVEPTSAALPALLPVVARVSECDAVSIASRHRPILPAGPPLDERLLDLPPPGVWS